MRGNVKKSSKRRRNSRDSRIRTSCYKIQILHLVDLQAKRWNWSCKEMRRLRIRRVLRWDSKTLRILPYHLSILSKGESLMWNSRRKSHTKRWEGGKRNKNRDMKLKRFWAVKRMNAVWRLLVLWRNSRKAKEKEGLWLAWRWIRWRRRTVNWRMILLGFRKRRIEVI